MTQQSLPKNTGSATEITKYLTLGLMQGYEMLNNLQ